MLVFAVGILLSGGDPSPSWLHFYSFVATIALIALGLWERWIWRWKSVQNLHIVPRDLRGTWVGTLKTQWVDASTGKTPPTKPAFVVVRQTWSSLSVTMFTDEMRSQSSLGKVTAGDGTASLDYMYLSRANSGVEHRSRMHHGSTSLDVIDNPATRLRGRY